MRLPAPRRAPQAGALRFTFYGKPLENLKTQQSFSLSEFYIGLPDTVSNDRLAMRHRRVLEMLLHLLKMGWRVLFSPACPACA